MPSDTVSYSDDLNFAFLTITSVYLNTAFLTISKFNRLTPLDTDLLNSVDLNIGFGTTDCVLCEQNSRASLDNSGLLDFRAELEPGVGRCFCKIKTSAPVFVSQNFAVQGILVGPQIIQR